MLTGSLGCAVFRHSVQLGRGRVSEVGCAVQMMQQQHMAAMQHMLTHLAVKTNESQAGSQAGGSQAGGSIMGGSQAPGSVVGGPAGGGSFMGAPAGSGSFMGGPAGSGSFMGAPAGSGSFMGAPDGSGSFMGGPAVNGSFMGAPAGSGSFMGAPGGGGSFMGGPAGGDSQMGQVPPTPQLGDSQYLGSHSMPGSPSRPGGSSQPGSVRQTPVDNQTYPLPPPYYAGMPQQTPSQMGSNTTPPALEQYYSGSFMGSQMGHLPPLPHYGLPHDGRSPAGSVTPTPRSVAEYNQEQAAHDGRVSPHLHSPHAYAPKGDKGPRGEQAPQLMQSGKWGRPPSGKGGVMHETGRSHTHGLPPDMVKELQESLEHIPSQESLRLQSASMGGVRIHPPPPPCQPARMCFAYGESFTASAPGRTFIQHAAPNSTGCVDWPRDSRATLPWDCGHVFCWTRLSSPTSASFDDLPR